MSINNGEVNELDIVASAPNVEKIRLLYDKLLVKISST